MASILHRLLGSSASKQVLVANYFDYDYNGVNYPDKLAGSLPTVNCAWADFALTTSGLKVLDRPITDFAYVVLGPVGDHHELYAAVISCIKACGVPYFSYGCSGESNSKLLQLARFFERSIPHPKTSIVTADAKLAPKLVGEFGTPVITKIIDGSQGKGILKHEAEASLAAELKKQKGKQLIIQEMLTAACDYRLFFLYDQLMYIDKRSATKKGEFRHNLSLGGKLEKVTLPPEAIAIAKAAQRSMGFDASGVDLLQDEASGRWYVLEVNAAPQFSEPHTVLNRLIELIKARL